MKLFVVLFVLLLFVGVAGAYDPFPVGYLTVGDTYIVLDWSACLSNPNIVFDGYQIDVPYMSPVAFNDLEPGSIHQVALLCPDWGFYYDDTVTTLPGVNYYHFFIIFFAFALCLFLGRRIWFFVPLGVVMSLVMLWFCNDSDALWYYSLVSSMCICFSLVALAGSTKLARRIFKQ